MDGWYEKLGIGELVDRAARLFGAKEALYYKGKRWTFAQLQEDVNRSARGLIQLGVEPGEKVALWMPNRPEWIHILFAVAKIGAATRISSFSVARNSRRRGCRRHHLLR